MGADGREGGRMLKAAGATIWHKMKRVVWFMACRKLSLRRVFLVKIYR
ncbi:hypothetical protein JCM19233_5476 [Vibrio astriarenae]|nr:hypothetical protein JCM19233_5476 [Vibrio sp. C7]